jgi:hypothetical protein
MDIADVATISIAYLDIRGNLSHLRYLLQRPRRRVPNVPLLVGLWPADEEVLKSDKLRRAVRAEYYLTFRREAVDACVTESEDGSGADNYGHSLTCRQRSGSMRVDGAPARARGLFFR